MERDGNGITAQTTIALIWDFDKTLIPGYMQTPLFERFGIDEEEFWREVNLLPDLYEKRGIKVSHDTVYLNHLLSFIKNGPLKGLQNCHLRELGQQLTFYPGLPDFFRDLKALARSKPEYIRHDLKVEHYIISTGLAEMIRGSAIEPEVDGIFACEFVENPLPPYFSRQDELQLDAHFEISQIGMMVDNTIKTRFVFEINKGSNKTPELDVNATMRQEDRRIPLRNMIYVADGPSDVPVFSVIRRGGGKAFAVYNPEKEEEFAQNDHLQQDGRVHGYGPADYTEKSSTSLWLKLHLQHLCDRIVREREEMLASRIGRAPRHLHRKDQKVPPTDADTPEQSPLFADEDVSG